MGAGSNVQSLGLNVMTDWLVLLVPCHAKLRLEQANRSDAPGDSQRQARCRKVGSRQVLVGPGEGWQRPWQTSKRTQRRLLQQGHLETCKGKVMFAQISLGPRIAVDCHSWRP